MNTGFGGFMRLIFQLNSKLHFTLLMAITLYSLLLLTTYLRHLSLSPIFFFFLQEYPTRQQKQNQTKLTRTQTQNTASKISDRERKKESLQKSEPSLKRFPAVSSTLSTHRSLPRYLTVPLTSHYTTLFYIFNPTLIINK